MLLRIEDTDRERSTDAATAAILEGLTWLGLTWEGEPISQFERAPRHREVAEELVRMGKAYYCYTTPAELDEMREKARAEGRPPRYDGRWRDRDPKEAPEGVKPVIRIKAPTEGETLVRDRVQGDVRFPNKDLDDFIILRSDGVPTYMHAVVVDDHDMGVTHIIRGDDHLTNAARQAQVYIAMGWAVPVFAHIPLIHGPDGQKLSKRHGAVGLEEYRRMGYPAAGMRNYLARLGWSHGDAEVFTDAEAQAWFDLAGIGRAPARLDLRKLEHVCGRHIAMAGDDALMAELDGFLQATGQPPVRGPRRDLLSRALPLARLRARTLGQVLEAAAFALAERPIRPEPAAAAALDDVSRGILTELTPHLRNASWTREALEAAVGAVAGARGLGLGKLAPALRAALAGRTTSPSVFDMMLVLGQAESLARIADAAA